MRKWVGALAVVVALIIGTGTASAAPAKKWPKLDLDALTTAFAAKGITACPQEGKALGGIWVNGAYRYVDVKLYTATRWATCPRQGPFSDPNIPVEENRASYSPEASLKVASYSSQRVFDRGVKDWKVLGHAGGADADLIGWKWPPAVFALRGGAAPDLIDGVAAAVKTLKPKAKVFFDNR